MKKQDKLNANEKKLASMLANDILDYIGRGSYSPAQSVVDNLKSPDDDGERLNAVIKKALQIAERMS